MNKLLVGLALSAFTLSACKNSNNKSSSANNLSDSSALATVRLSPSTSPVDGILQIYLQMKNDFANDDSKGAATAGKTMLKAFNGFDVTILREDERKTFTDIAADAKENAEHIGENAGNIKHQREHFDMLSKDMYELVKTSKAGEPIFVDYCPMYNDNKGAIWLSETKEIKNPYLGKEMETCGSVKEELK